MKVAKDVSTPVFDSMANPTLAEPTGEGFNEIMIIVVKLRNHIYIKDEVLSLFLCW